MTNMTSCFAVIYFFFFMIKTLRLRGFLENNFICINTFQIFLMIGIKEQEMNQFRILLLKFDLLLWLQGKQLLRQLTALGQDLFYYSKLVASRAPDSRHNTDLKLVLTSSSILCKMLLIKVEYVSEYQIPGTPKPGSCHFTYRSTSRLEGRFNSPRHPQNYPNQLNCTYLFLATPSQQVS